MTFFSKFVKRFKQWCSQKFMLESTFVTDDKETDRPRCEKRVGIGGISCLMLCRPTLVVKHPEARRTAENSGAVKRLSLSLL